MKSIQIKSQKLCLLLLVLGLLLTSSMKCKKEKTGIDALPLTTQEGKGTFGCLINGEVFLPKGNFSVAPITCTYQYSSSEGQNGYYFILTITNIGNPYTSRLQLLTDSVKFVENSIYKLQTHQLNSKGVAFARYVKTKNDDFAEEKYNTKDQLEGELKITKLDEVQQIISGTFWFEAINDKGEKIEVREGRFDMNYIK